MVKEDISLKIKEELETSRKNESLFAKLLENSSQPFGVGYPDGRLGLVNKAFEELTGYSREELKNTDWSEILTPREFQNMEKEILEELQHTGQPVRYQKEYILKDGTRVPIELLVHIVKNEDGSPEYYYSFITDISESKISEKLKQELLEKEQQLTEELTASNEELQSTTEELQVTNEELQHSRNELLIANQRISEVLGSITDAFYMLDSDWNFIYINKPAAASVNKEPKELIGQNIWKIFPQYKGTIIEKNYRKAMKNNKTIIFESYGQYTGSWYTLTINPTDEGITVLSTDITERKKVEETLKESEHKYSQLFNSMSEMFQLIELIYDEKGKPIDMYYRDVNPAIESFVDKTKEQLIDKRGKDVFGIVEDYWLNLWDRVAKTGIPEQFENYGAALDKYYVVNVWMANETQIATTFTDITDRKKAEEELKKKAALLDISYEAIFSWNLDKGIQSWNHGAEILYGYTEKEAIGHVSHDLLKTQFPIEFKEFKEILTRNKSWTGELVHTKKDGNKIIVESRLQMIKDTSGINVIIETNRDITERKKTENILRESEEKYRNIVEIANEGIMIADPSGRINFVNTKMAEMLGYSSEELIGTDSKSFVDKNEQELGLQKIENRKKGIQESYEIKYIRKSGEELWCLISATPMYDHYGKHIGNMTMQTDITERKISEKLKQELLEKEQQLTEELQSSNEELQSTTEELYKSNDELHKSSKLLSTIYDLNPDAIVLTTVSDSKIIDCNQEYLNQIGYSREETIEHTSEELDLISEITRNTNIDETRGNERISNFEGKIKRKDGSFIDVLYSTRQIKVNNEQVILNIGRDVTKSKRIEKTLQESEERFRNLADNIPNLAWMADADGWIFWYNKQWYEYTGTTFEEMQGWGWQKVHHPDYVDSVTEEWSTKILKGEPYDNIFPLKGKNGNYRWFLTRITPIRDEHGKVQRWFGTNTDVTERKNIEENLKTTMDDLKQSNKELEQFAYITSHDLREPLRMITSFLQLLERRYKDRLDQDANEFIGFAVNGAKRLDTMTNDLLKYSQISNKKREAIPVNFEHVLEHALENLKVQIEENYAIITHDSLPIIVGDEELKIQLFQNIIGNAIKYRSQETPKIHISAIKEKNQYLFSIKDNGIGMSSKHLEKIFTIFQRLHTNEEYEGTGIGLAIAQKIVHQQGGQIWAESEPGKGTTFYFTIPTN